MLAPLVTRVLVACLHHPGKGIAEIDSVAQTALPGSLGDKSSGAAPPHSHLNQDAALPRLYQREQALIDQVHEQASQRACKTQFLLHSVRSVHSTGPFVRENCAVGARTPLDTCQRLPQRHRE